MAIISSYPTITPTSSDLVLIVDTSEDGNPTKTATVGSVAGLVQQNYVEKTVSISNAQWLGLASTSVEIIPSPGTGKAIQVILAHVKYFPSGGNFEWDQPLTLSNGTGGAVSLVTQGVIPIDYSDVDGDGDIQIFTISGSDVSLNGAINFGCASGATITGGGTLSITVRYQVI